MKTCRIEQRKMHRLDTLRTEYWEMCQVGTHRSEQRKILLSGYIKNCMLEDVPRVAADKSGRVTVQSFHNRRSPGV